MHIYSSFLLDIHSTDAFAFRRKCAIVSCNEKTHKSKLCRFETIQVQFYFDWRRATIHVTLNWQVSITIITSWVGIVSLVEARIGIETEQLCAVLSWTLKNISCSFLVSSRDVNEGAISKLCNVTEEPFLINRRTWIIFDLSFFIFLLLTFSTNSPQSKSPKITRLNWNSISTILSLTLRLMLLGSLMIGWLSESPQYVLLCLKATRFVPLPGFFGSHCPSYEIKEWLKKRMSGERRKRTRKRRKNWQRAASCLFLTLASFAWQQENSSTDFVHLHCGSNRWQSNSWELLSSDCWIHLRLKKTISRVCRKISVPDSSQMNCFLLWKIKHKEKNIQQLARRVNRDVDRLTR